MLDQVEAFLGAHGVHDDVLFRVRLALDELLTNAVTHGAQNNAKHDIEVLVEVDGDQVVCILRDNGVAFDPLSMPEPDTTAALDDRNIGGLGIHLVREMFSDLNYRRDGGWNILRFASPIGEQN